MFYTSPFAPVDVSCCLMKEVCLVLLFVFPSTCKWIRPGDPGWSLMVCVWSQGGWIFLVWAEWKGIISVLRDCKGMCQLVFVRVHFLKWPRWISLMNKGVRFGLVCPSSPGDPLSLM